MRNIINNIIRKRKKLLKIVRKLWLFHQNELPTSSIGDTRHFNQYNVLSFKIIPNSSIQYIPYCTAGFGPFILSC